MQERQVRVVADAKDVRLRTLRCGQLFPGGLVPRRNLAILDGPACGSAITEQDEITAAVSTSSALLQAFVQHMLHIRAAGWHERNPERAEWMHYPRVRAWAEKVASAG